MLVKLMSLSNRMDTGLIMMMKDIKCMRGFGKKELSMGKELNSIEMKMIRSSRLLREFSMMIKQLKVHYLWKVERSILDN